MTNIILCGGNGTRLWPISRTLMPKQFVKLFDDKSLFQLTVERNSKVCDSQFIVSNAEQYFLAVDQLEALKKTNNKYLLEPVGRNTAPAIALACMASNKEELVLVTPSDHLIKDELEYKLEEQKTISFFESVLQKVLHFFRKIFEFFYNIDYSDRFIQLSIIVGIFYLLSTAISILHINVNI